MGRMISLERKVLALSDPRLFTRFWILGLFGVIGPILTLALMGLAISQAPWFSWTGDALSDLGVHGQSAVLFNSGLIAGGVLSVIFALGVMRYYLSQRVGRCGAFFLLLAGIFLVSIGVFPETAPNNIHYAVSVAFFATFPMSLLIQSAALLSIGVRRKLGAFTLTVAIAAAVPWAIWLPLKPYNGVAIPELVSALAATAWSIVMGTLLMRERHAA